MDVTVLITTYRRPALLERCVLSAVAQSFDNFEILVIDDASNDSTIDVLKKLQARHPNRLRYISKKQNKGLAHSRNLGVENAKGKYIAFLDDDDYWTHDQVINTQLAIAHQKTIVCGSVVNSDGLVLTPSLPDDWQSRLVYRNGFIHTSTVMIAKNLIVMAGKFDENLSRGIDSDLYRRLVFEHDINLTFVPVVMAYYELTSTNRITTKRNTLRVRLRRMYEMLYQLWKYRNIARTHPKDYLKRIVISAKKILK